MAHFAKINSENIVEQVLVVPNEQEHRGEEYLNELGFIGTWIQTSYNNNFRKRFAGIGMTYDPENDVFIRPKKFDSWILNSDFEWEAPIPLPEDDKSYDWNEEKQTWVLQTSE